MTLTTGNQLKAARALCGLGQTELAERSEVHANTIRKMESQGESVLSSGLATIQKVQRTLEAAGVEFIAENGGGPGVRLKKSREGE
ncbi:MAG: helix-turn-helix transcriptional regulator [Gammaproteobacteria bacterium]|nr:helix-turn-helix transcriptional regulator [Gammaproteobacteria bacterium]